MVAINTKYTIEPHVNGGSPIMADGKVIFNDMLGSSLGTVENGTFKEISRTSFGDQLSNSSTPELSNFSNDFFTGKPSVEGLGYAFLFRNYRSDLGKWMSSDPLGYPDGWNNLAYVKNHVICSFDYLGMYEIEWEGTWSEAEKVQVTSSFTASKTRMETIVAQITVQENSINSSVPGASDLLANLALLKNGLQSTIDNINSTGYNLEIYKTDLGSESLAKYWPSSVPWYDDELTINNGASYNWFVIGDIGTIFHEVTHSWSDDGESGNDYMNAHLIESLYTTDLVNWLRYMFDYMNVFGVRPE